MKIIGVLLLCFLTKCALAGQWLYGKKILRPEVRGGESVSVILSDSIPEGAEQNLCTSNRVYFQKDKGISQEAVSQYLSLLLSTYALKQEISIHVEYENNFCFGRIAYPEA